MPTETFQCNDCTEVLPMNECGYATKEPYRGQVWNTFYCHACIQKQEADDMDGEPLTRTEYWDSYED